ncbi:MAG: hypothetical protein Q9169_001538 [Polycauliona sp. 2 TL-2023]
MAISTPELSDDKANNSQSLSPPEHTSQPSHTSIYDGSDYGDDSDLEDVRGIPSSLEHRLAAIESLARRGVESNGSGADTVVVRVAESLRDLVSQTGVETGASRSYGHIIQYHTPDPSHPDAFCSLHVTALFSSES